jgi:hypothetical protein
MNGRVRGVLFVFLASGCGSDSSPTAPALPVAPTPLPVINLRNGLTGAVVQGTITQSGGRVKVTGAGFLTREQDANTDVVWLWPQNEAYIQTLVYTHGGVNGGRIRLYRWAPGSTIRLALGPTLAGDAVAEARLRSVASEAARWSRLSVTITSVPSANVIFEVDREATLAASPTAGAAAYGQSSGWTMIGARVVFLDRATAVSSSGSSMFLHEMGHVLGLQHSPNTADIMNATRPLRSEAFGGDEAAALTMMYLWRQAGNQFPDLALGIPASAGVSTTVIAN